MNTVGQLERATQNRVVMLLANQLGWQYLGNWQDRDVNSNIEESYLRAYLQNHYSDKLIDKAIRELSTVSGDQPEICTKSTKTYTGYCGTASKSGKNWVKPNKPSGSSIGKNH